MECRLARSGLEFCIKWSSTFSPFSVQRIDSGSFYTVSGGRISLLMIPRHDGESLYPLHTILTIGCVAAWSLAFEL